MSFFDNETAYLSAFCDAEPLPHGVRLHDALPARTLNALVSAEIARGRAQGADAE